MMRMPRWMAVVISMRTKSSGSASRFWPASSADAHVGPITAIKATLEPTARSISFRKSTPTPMPLTSRKNRPGYAAFSRSYNRPVAACESLRR